MNKTYFDLDTNFLVRFPFGVKKKILHILLQLMSKNPNVTPLLD
jgi:hypothetical protein